MAPIERPGGLAYREAGPAGAPVALLRHGYPEPSWMWRSLMDALAAAGWRGIAPDLAGYGDSEPDPPGTWDRRSASLGRFADELGLRGGTVAVHDWGGLIALRWACDTPGAVCGRGSRNPGCGAEG